MRAVRRYAVLAVLFVLGSHCIGANCPGLPAPAMIRVLVERADAFAMGAPQQDDMTLVVARVGRPCNLHDASCLSC